jgi:hypothetical protein
LELQISATVTAVEKPQFLKKKANGLETTISVKSAAQYPDNETYNTFWTDFFQIGKMQ